MQITLRLCDSLHAKVREKARELGRSVNSYLVQLIQSDLQLAESRVPAETTTVKKSPVMLAAEELLEWSIQHEGEEPDDDTIMREFGWSERMIPARRSLFKALSRKDSRSKEVRENFIRKTFDALNEMQDVWRNIKDFDRKLLCERFKVSGSYLDVILKALWARDVIGLDEDHATGREEVHILGYPCGSQGCNGIISMKIGASPQCPKCGWRR